MAKVKSSKIADYELLYLIPNKFSEDEVPAINEKVNKIIEEKQGTVKKTEDWGKKRLAYPIKSYTYGYYHLCRISVDGEKINEIDRLMGLAPEILRHIIIKDEGRKNVQPIRKAVPEAEAAKTERPKESAKIEEKSSKKEASKVDLKDLDERLDKILEGGDLLK